MKIEKIIKDVPDTVKTTNIMIIGGFLGSGKTTSIAAITKHLMEAGRKAGIIINEFGSSLVDLEYLKRKGFKVVSITGGCLNCSFLELKKKIEELNSDGDLDYILIEPAGSCTGLSQSIIKSLQEEHRGEYRILPISVLVDPMRLLTEFILEEKRLPKETQNIIFKQMEESDIIVVNKADTISKEEIQKIDAFLQKRFINKKVLYINAVINGGIDLWLDKIETMSLNKDAIENRQESSDCKVYARAEAKLVRFDLHCDFTLQSKISGNYLLNSLADTMKHSLKIGSHEIAHLKIYLDNGNAACKLSCTGLYDENTFDKKISVPIGSGKLFVNIGVDCSPDELNTILITAIDSVFHDVDGLYENLDVEYIKPDCIKLDCIEPVSKN